MQMKKRKELSMRYQITSDSTCDLSPEQLERYNIRLLPLYVSMDGKTLRDGVDVKPDDIYAHVSAGGSLPQTAAVNLADYVRAFTELSEKNDFVIHVCISLDFSCCYQNAKLAAADFDNVYVVDSRNLSTGHGLVVLEAERMAREGMDKAQKEYFLREQIKAIRHELGDAASEGEEELDELRKALDKAGLPKDVRKEADKQLRRLSGMHADSSEANVVRTYLDWLVELPWKKLSRDRLDIAHAKAILDEDHYGLDKIKDRILEFLSVRKLNPQSKGPILCFAGPPGVGKTSLGRSIARALGRHFQRLSLGGMHDEAEIRGHRRTYIGAMPGRIIQAIKQAGTRNPVIVLDEVDKLGSDFRGDPSSALLEVLDPEQNHTFSDHYLNVPFDLSKVMFLCTANHLETIPAPLRDRMEVISLPGYTMQEKVEIAKRHLLPKKVTENGLREGDVIMDDTALTAVIRGFFTISRMRARSERLPDDIVVAQSVCCMTPLLPEIWSRSVRP